MVPGENRTERFAHAAPNHLGGTQFLGRAPAPSVESGPDSWVVSLAAAIEPRRMHARGGGPAKDGVGRGGLGAGEAKQFGRGRVFLGTAFEGERTHWREHGRVDA